MTEESTQEFEGFEKALDRIMARGRGAGGGSPRFSHGGQRDLWDSLGYPSDAELSYEDYRAWFERGGISKPIIEKPPATTWKEAPAVTDRDVADPDDADDTTSFEADIGTLFDADGGTGLTRGLRHYLERVDLLGRIGEYSVLFLGLADVENADGLAAPVDTATLSAPSDLLFLTPLGQGDVDVESWVDDVTDPRNGLPETYELNLANGDRDEKHVVHHSRVIHVAEGVVDDEVHGEPAIRSVINRLIDIQKIAGAAGEAYWRVSNPGLALSVDSDLQDVPTEKMDEQVEEWEHKLRRVLKLYGTDVEQLDAQDVDPEAALDSAVKLVAGAVGIPQRKLVGSERGELASSMDEATYLGAISERQTSFAEPVVLRPFIDRLVEFGVLSPPQGGEYTVHWPDLFELTDLERAEVKKTEAETAKALAPLEDISALHSIEALQQHSPIDEPEDAPDVTAEPDAEIDEDDEQVIEEFERLQNLAPEDLPAARGSEADD